jgi:putative addiction module component (TIGR02574 family)
MSVDAILEAIRALSPDERAEFDARYESEALPELPELTPELKAELERRMAEADANPGALVPWEEVYQASLKRAAR